MQPLLLTFGVMVPPELKHKEDFTFGRYFKQIRESKGISQAFVAKKAGITVTQLSRIENGQSGTKRETVLQLTKAASFSEEENQEMLRLAGYASHNSDFLPKPVLDALNRSKCLMENDYILIANFIEMLNKQRIEEQK